MKTTKSIGRSILLGLAVLAALVIYAYGFQVTKVSLNEIQSPRRQESLTRVLRALARPDILAYKQDEVTIQTTILVPCPTGAAPSPTPVQDAAAGPSLVVPSCAEPRSQMQIEGFNFPPDSEGPLMFIPPSEVTLNLGSYRADASGHFLATVRVPPRPSPDTQYIRTVTRQNVGTPYLTQTAKDTWSKIVETVFLALLATTFGVALAIPISFFAARNLMRDITTTLSSLALSILAWPAGIWLGSKAADWIGSISQGVADRLALSLPGILVSAVVIWGAARWALPQEEVRRPGPGLRLARWLALLAAALVAVLALFLLAGLAVSVGNAIAPRLGAAGFLGTFLANLGQILNLLISAITALFGGAVLSSLAGRVGKHAFLRLPPAGRLALNLVLGALAGAVLFALIRAGIDWLYQINDLNRTLWFPVVAGALLGLLAAILTRRQDSLPVGLVVYYVTRTILNALRAIEALIMAIVFVVWVGIGPFAGVLALSLHTIAALAKLYSEQVESISAGPLEAVKATGATRLQTIMYAVIPQIIPPYISFTMYRWDINVRMSTIIGFAGGGGIGFLLIQNINLLNYRAASAQMLAIAIVVAMMDFLSSYMRERVV